MPDNLPVHSPLGASSAERWVNCPGSVALIKKLELPENDSEDYRERGTAAHEAAAKCLTDGLDAWEVIGEKHNAIEVDEEIAVAIQVYLDYVRGLATPGVPLLVETRISHPAHPLFYGTVDCGVVEGTTLWVTDYKHGEGIQVDVWDNPQIMYYAYGLLRRYPDVETVILSIVQPRGFHHEGSVRVWETTADYIRDWAETELIPAMNRVELDNTLDAGPWCRFCPAKLVCPLLTSLFGAACNANPAHIINLSDESLGRSYQYTQAVKFYLKAMEDETYRRLNSGRQIVGTKLVLKRANRVWDVMALALLPVRFGAEAMKEPEVKSPAELEKLSPEAKSFVKQWAYAPQTGLTVALEADKRLAVKVETAEQAFGSAAAQLEGSP